MGDEKPIKNLLKNEYISDYEVMYHISWEDYYNQCNIPSWSDNNMASTQIKCSILDNVNINWEGYVKEVKLRSVRNQWSVIVSWLPSILSEYVKCYYGEAISCESVSLEDCGFVTSVARQSGKSCHLNNLNE